MFLVFSELALRVSFGSEFQTFGAATQNARLAVSVRVHGTERRGASVDPETAPVCRCRLIRYINCIIHGDMKETVSGCFFLNTVKIVFILYRLLLLHCTFTFLRHDLSQLFTMCLCH